MESEEEPFDGLPLATASPLIVKPILPMIAMNNNPEEQSALTTLAAKADSIMDSIPRLNPTSTASSIISPESLKSLHCLQLP